MLFLALGDAKVPDARYFAFWWNIGLKIQDIAIFAVRFSIFSKSVLHMKLAQISEIGTGKISSGTGKMQGI